MRHPAVQLLLPVVQRPDRPVEVGDRQPDPLDTFGPVRVLVAEDNAVNQQVIATLLRQVGLEPVIVGNGAEAATAWAKPGM